MGPRLLLLRVSVSPRLVLSLAFLAPLAAKAMLENAGYSGSSPVISTYADSTSFTPCRSKIAPRSELRSST